MDVLNEAFGQAGIGAPVAVIAAAPHQVVGLALVAPADPVPVEETNKNPWVVVANRRKVGRMQRRRVREGGQPEDLIYEESEPMCLVGVPWVQKGRTIRERRRLSMARKCMTVTSDGEEAIWLFGSYGPCGIEY